MACCHLPLRQLIGPRANPSHRPASNRVVVEWQAAGRPRDEGTSLAVTAAWGGLLGIARSELFAHRIGSCAGGGGLGDRTVRGRPVGVWSARADCIAATAGVSSRRRRAEVVTSPTPWR